MCLNIKIITTEEFLGVISAGNFRIMPNISSDEITGKIREQIHTVLPAVII